MLVTDYDVFLHGIEEDNIICYETSLQVRWLPSFFAFLINLEMHNHDYFNFRIMWLFFIIVWITTKLPYH